MRVSVSTPFIPTVSRNRRFGSPPQSRAVARTMWWVSTEEPTHAEQDPADPDPWDTVGTEFRKLGHRLRETYRQVADDTGPAEDDVREALATLAQAWGQVAGSVGEALRDPEVRENLKAAATSFAGALGSTISDLSVELARTEEE